MNQSLHDIARDMPGHAKCFGMAFASFDHLAFPYVIPERTPVTVLALTDTRHRGLALGHEFHDARINFIETTPQARDRPAGRR